MVLPVPTYPCRDIVPFSLRLRASRYAQANPEQEPRVGVRVEWVRRRMLHVFGHGSNLKLVSAAGLAPAISRSQTEGVGYYATRWMIPVHLAMDRDGWSDGYEATIPLSCFAEDGGLEPRHAATCRGQSSRRQRVALLIELRAQMVGSAGNAPARHFRLCFLTPDLQSGSRITSLENWLAEP